MKKIDRLVKKGWKQAEIKYTRFRVYEKNNQRVLYDTIKNKIIRRYKE